MIIVGLILVGILAWAIKSGQYDDLEGDANRVIMDDDDPLLPGNKSKQRSENTRKKQPGKNWPDADVDDNSSLKRR